MLFRSKERKSEYVLINSSDELKVEVLNLFFFAVQFFLFSVGTIKVFTSARYIPASFVT